MERPSKKSRKKVIAGVATPTQGDLELLARLASDAELKPVIDRCYPLESAAQAHEFSKRVGLRSPRYLKLVIDGKRNLTAAIACRFAAPDAPRATA